MIETDKLIENGAEQESAPLPAHKGIYMNLLAALACVLIALVVWVCVMNAHDTDYIPLRVYNPQSGVTYEFSADNLQVEGRVSALKDLTVISIVLPEGLPFGTYRLTEADLNLPDGVHPADDLQLTLTVRGE